MKTSVLLIIVFFISAFGIYAQTDSSKGNAQIIKFFELLKSADYYNASNLFSYQVKNLISSDKLESIWNGLSNQYGNFENIIDINQRKLQGVDLFQAKVNFQNYIIEFSFTFESTNLISGFRIFNVLQKGDNLIAPYSDTSKFTEKNVSFGLSEWKLNGKLTIPNNCENCPIVILVHGSGPQSMDVDIGPNQIFKDIAYGLSTLGIAVLRYNKRTFEHGAKFMETYVSGDLDDEVIDDAIEAINFIKNDPSFDESKLFVVGHSLGAMLAPRIANKSDNVDGIVMIAPNARKLQEVIRDQYSYLFELDGDISDIERNELDNLSTQITKSLSSDLSSDTDPSELPLGLPASYWVYLNNYNQVDELDELNLPAFLVLCGRDYQIPEKDRSIWYSRFKNSDRVQYKNYIKLNHILMNGEGDTSTPSEYNIRGFVSQEIINDISKWIIDN